MRIGKLLSSLVFAGLILSAPTTYAQTQNPRQWQEVKTVNSNYKAVSSLPDIEVFNAPNVIMVKVAATTEVRIFTILGKLISSQKLQPGIYEFHMDSHGIYIIKTEGSSCKIAI